MDGASQHNVEVANDMQGIVYLQQGATTINNEELQPGDAMQINNGDNVAIVASQDSRLMIALGKPHLETVRLTGGFVD